MDLKALREQALEATSRALYDRHGILPSEDSEEWEEEYRRQFALARKQLAGAAAGPRSAPPPPPETAAPDGERQWPELSGPPEQKRWAATIRAARLKDVPGEAMRLWFAQTWTRAKQWVDTRDVPTAVLLQRLQPQYAEYRRQAADAAKTRAAEAQQKAAAAAAFQDRLAAAGVTPQGLIELIDASERAEPVALTAKLAEISLDGRALRLYETKDPNVLLVKEKNAAGQEEYGIARDEGLVSDLRLFAQTP